jgi:hypothetical protein
MKTAFAPIAAAASTAQGSTPPTIGLSVMLVATWTCPA